MSKLINLKNILAVLSLLSCLAQPCLANATSWPLDVGSTNPSGQWSFGAAPMGGTFQLGLPLTVSAYPSLKGFVGSGGAGILKNTSSQTITTDGNNSWAPSGMQLHPGSSGEYAIARWTAPAQGNYSIATTMARGNWALCSASVDMLVFQNGRLLYSGLLTKYDVPQSYSGTVSLRPGDTIDFAVGYGSERNFACDSTKVVASVTQIAPTLTGLSLSCPSSVSGGAIISCTTTATYDDGSSKIITTMDWSKINDYQPLLTVNSNGDLVAKTVTADTTVPLTVG